MCALEIDTEVFELCKKWLILVLSQPQQPLLLDACGQPLPPPLPPPMLDAGGLPIDADQQMVTAGGQLDIDGQQQSFAHDNCDQVPPYLVDSAGQPIISQHPHHPGPGPPPPSVMVDATGQPVPHQVQLLGVMHLYFSLSLVV